jgi:hypothetical protein
MSSNRTGTPALANCAAMPAPMTPAPMTVALRIAAMLWRSFENFQPFDVKQSRRETGPM